MIRELEMQEEMAIWGGECLNDQAGSNGVSMCGAAGQIAGFVAASAVGGIIGNRADNYIFGNNGLLEPKPSGEVTTIWNYIGNGGGGTGQSLTSR